MEEWLPLAKEPPVPTSEQPTDHTRESGVERDRITELLRAHGAGDEEAMSHLAPLVYERLRAIAHRQMAGEQAGHTLQTTGLVHEAYLRLVDLDRINLRDRDHFFSLAARLMRQILIDYARKRRAAKRGGGMAAVEFEEAVGTPAPSVSLDLVLALDAALDRLASTSARQARIVECRVFGAMSVQETARALGVSTATVKREWQLARARLNRELSG